MTYRLEYTVLENEPVLVRRPWYKFWGRDKISFTANWKRKVLHGLSREQGEHVLAMHANQQLNELLVSLACQNYQQIMDMALYNEGDSVITTQQDESPSTFKLWRPQVH